MSFGTDRARFDAARHESDAAREDFIIRMLTPTACRMHATILEIEKATAAGVQALSQGRSRAFALAMARRQIPKRSINANATLTR